MDIFLIRHADAVSQGNGIASDEERPLSETGWKQAAAMGHAFKRRGIAIDLIVSSPLVRAVQTATQLHNILQLGEQQLQTSDELAPEGRPKKLSRFVNGLQANSIALVGHQPDLSLSAGWLLGEKELAIQFAKGGAAFLRTEGSFVKGAAVLIWLLTPEWLE